MRKVLAAFISAIPLIFASSSAQAGTCATVAACALYQNTGAGIAIEGISRTNVAIYGVSSASHGVDGRSSTSFGTVGITYADGTAPGTARVGVLGEDLSTTDGGYNGGVAGVSTFAIGSEGLSTYATGVYGSSTSGVGVYGVSQGSEGVYGVGSGTGAYFAATEPYDNYCACAVGVIGYGDIGGHFYGTGSAGQPGVAISNAGVGLYIEDTDTNVADLSVPIFSAYSDALNSEESVSIDADGNEYLHGTLTQAGSAVARTHSSSGADVASYGARSASPTIEDFGSGTLRDGVATVALDRTFASTIAPGYMVFVTPHGDSNSLYTENAAGGFIVRESKGGKSTLAFDYRIVARPSDATGTHLALMSSMHRAHKRLTLPKLPARPTIKASRPIFR